MSTRNTARWTSLLPGRHKIVSILLSSNVRAPDGFHLARNTTAGSGRSVDTSPSLLLSSGGGGGGCGGVCGWRKQDRGVTTKQDELMFPPMQVVAPQMRVCRLTKELLCVRACVHACVRACVRVYVVVCEATWLYTTASLQQTFGCISSAVGDYC